MGTWGPQAFENDEALDWVPTIESAEDFRKPLLQIIDHSIPGDAWSCKSEARVCQRAVAAAAVVALSRGARMSSSPPEISSLLKEQNLSATNEDIDLAIQVLNLLRRESELKQMWDDAVEGNWLCAIDKLMKDLSKAKVSKANPEKRNGSLPKVTKTVDPQKTFNQAIEKLFSMQDTNPDFDFRRGSGDPQVNAREGLKLIDTCLSLLEEFDRIVYMDTPRYQLLAELYARKGACSFHLDRYSAGITNYKKAIELDANREAEMHLPILMMATKQYFCDEAPGAALESFNYIVSSQCHAKFTQLQLSETGYNFYPMPMVSSWSVKAFAFLFSGLCKFALGDRDSWTSDIENSLRTDPQIEGNILARLMWDLIYEPEKAVIMIEVVLSVQPDNAYFKCLKHLLSAHHGSNEEREQALCEYEALDGAEIAKRSVGRGTLPVAAEQVRQRIPNNQSKPYDETLY